MRRNDRRGHAGRCVALVLAGAALASGAQAVISGIPDTGNHYSAVARLGGRNCSAVLVARRVALTSAHCLADFATQCFPYASGNLQLRFAEPDGTVNAANVTARTIDVQAIEVHHDAAVDVSQCNTGDPCAGDNLDCSEFNSGVCLDPDQLETPGSVNRSSELVVLFLADDAPPDVTPMKILVHPTFKNSSDRFVSFAGLETWAQTHPLVTAVGFGNGSEDYPDGMGGRLTGRDRGVLRWQATSSHYGGTLGWDDCTTRAADVAVPAVVVSPDDITNDQAPEPQGSQPAWCYAANSDDIDGASQSHVSCGDSGGPMVVGAGPGAKGETPTSLPAPAAGDTYLQGGHYVAGTASAYVANIGDHPATAYNPTWTESASSFLTSQLFDSDGDGLVDKLDEFPGCDDLGQDTDLDGVPDDCDPCPCDPDDNDDDGDGLCRTSCYGTGDNCWKTANPGQENCNRVAELAHTPGSILGDACDPVPCPETTIEDTLLQANVVDYHFGSGYSQFWVRCSSYRHNQLHLRPLRSHPASGVNASPANVDDVPTHARFCQRDPSRGILCDDAFGLQDARLDDADCAPPASCVDPETIDTHWHRMTFLQGGNGSDPNGPAANLDYDRPAGQGGGTVQWVWNYTADWQRWTQQGLIDNAATPAGLDGALWLHADTPVGSSDTSLGTGYHGHQLANDHATQYRPQTLSCATGTTFRAVQTPFFLFLTLPDPPPFDLRRWENRRWDATPGEASYVVPVAGSEWGAIDSQGNAQVVTSRMAGSLQSLLRDRSLVWANTAEPFLHGAGGAEVPTAVALSADGSDIVGGMTVDGGQLGAAQGIAGRAGSPHATGFVPVYSRGRRGVFVVGGRDPETRRPTGEIWFTPVRGERWRRIRTDIEPQSVLAATYDHTGEALWVLDQTDDGEARLWTHDLAKRESKVLGRWPRHPEWDRHWLVLDADGSILLASSSSRRRRHAIARIARTETGERRLNGILRARRSLLLPPLADGAGYTRITAGVPGWPAETVAAITGARVGPGARVVGDVAALGDATGALEVEAHGRVEGWVTAERVRVQQTGEVAGGVVRTRRFEGLAEIEAEVLELPELPPRLERPDPPRVGAGAEPVLLRPGETRTLAPGEYGRALLQGDRSTILHLSGGRYGFHSLDLGAGTTMLCDEPCDVVVQTRLRTDTGARIGAGNRDLAPAQVRLYVTGGDAEIGTENRLDARFFVARGDLAIGAGTTALGTFVARAVAIGEGATVTRDEGSIFYDREGKLPLEPAEWTDLAGQL